MPKPGPSETSGLNVPAWSFKDQPKDQKFPHPSGKTSEKEMGTWQPWIYLPAPPGNRKKQLLYCSGGCERTHLEVCAHFHVPPSSSWRTSEWGQFAGFITEGHLCLGAIFLRTHLVRRKGMRSSVNPRICGAPCRVITWEGLSPLPKAPAWLGFLAQQADRTQPHDCLNK